MPLQSKPPFFVVQLLGSCGSQTSLLRCIQWTPDAWCSL